MLILAHYFGMLTFKFNIVQYIISGNICGLEKEVKDIHTNLIDIEILYCIKTSPENIDELRDRPQSVKIARSLRAKITRKRLKHTTTNVVMRDIDSPF